MTILMRAAVWLVLATGIAEAFSAAGAATLREEAGTYSSGDVELAGLLLLPTGRGPHPAAVIIQGSGDSDRTNGWARSISETIAEAGYAVLLTDKRGSGASGGDWHSGGFEVLADDALAGLSYLASRPSIDKSRIGLVGLSQGGRVVPVAAARSDAVAFAINIVGDAVSFAEQSAHEMSNVARQAKLPEPLREQVLQLNAAAGRALLTGDWSEYARLREAGLAAPWAPVARGFPPVGDPIWTFYGKAFAFDPMPYWTLVRRPALILYGEQDEADNVAVAESVRRLRFGFGVVGKDNYEIVVLPGVGHSLGWTSEGGLGAGAIPAIRDWLAANVRQDE
ncbi:MAG: alpha/beta hydrolase family protein [Sphingomicrobium sp.]